MAASNSWPDQSTDDGTLGTATRDLLAAQHTQAGGHQVFSLQGYQRYGQLAKGTQHYNLLRQVCIMADADIELQGPGMQLELSCSTLMTALKLAAPEVPGKRNNPFNKSLIPLLELGCTRIEQAVCRQGACFYLIPGSHLKALHGNKATPKHIAAFNDLSRILTATTRPKRADELLT